MADTLNDPDPAPPKSSDSLEHNIPDSPITPGSLNSSEASTPHDTPNEPAFDAQKDIPKRMPSLRSVSDSQAPGQHMSASSTHIGVLSNARRPPAPPPTSGRLPEGLNAKMKAFALSRQGSSTSTQQSSTSTHGPSPGGAISGLPAHMQQRGPRPTPAGANSDPIVPSRASSLAKKKNFLFKLSDLGGGGGPSMPPPAGGGADAPSPQNGSQHMSKLKQFEDYINTEKGYLTFKGKAIISDKGVDFSDGTVFRISLDEVEKLDELGKGNYGTVYKVRHTKPRVPRFGPGLSGIKPSSTPSLPTTEPDVSDVPVDGKSRSASGMVMAMKEIRLELDEAKLATIIKELVILHECASPYIIDFYGAFFQESAVYICLEYMDGGSIDKLYSGGIPESVLRKITYCTIMGLKELKDKHNIIHRDVKPTNILVNTRGQVKICDFGVSGNLVASIAKTNIGCQSYMAPERISGGQFMQTGASDGTYSVQSDVWSLGLTIIECAMGKYPYPPEVSSTIFSQLSAIVEGDPPSLPEKGYSDTARAFVLACLNKVPKLRPSYQALLGSDWLQTLTKPETITEDEEEEHENEASAAAVTSAADHMDLSHSSTEDAEVAAWVRNALERKASGLYEADKKPALHAAPLDAVNSPMASPQVGH